MDGDQPPRDHGISPVATAGPSPIQKALDPANRNHASRFVQIDFVHQRKEHAAVSAQALAASEKTAARTAPTESGRPP
jgi:hypothetical protein